MSVQGAPAQACVRACVRAYVHGFIRSFVHSSVRPSIHPSVRPSVRSWVRICVRVPGCVFAYRCACLCGLHTCVCARLRERWRAFAKEGRRKMSLSEPSLFGKMHPLQLLCNGKFLIETLLSTTERSQTWSGGRNTGPTETLTLQKHRPYRTTGPTETLALQKHRPHRNTGPTETPVPQAIDICKRMHTCS